MEKVKYKRTKIHEIDNVQYLLIQIIRNEIEKCNSELCTILTMLVLGIYNHELVNPIIYKGTVFHDMK